MAFLDEKTGSLVTHWKSVSAITALVGSGVDAKIWPHVGNQGQSPPWIAYTRAGGMPIIHLGGQAGVETISLHVYCYGATYAQADTLARAVRDNTRSMRGTYTGVVVNRVQVMNIDDGFEYVEQGKDAKRYWVRLIADFVLAES